MFVGCSVAPAPAVQRIRASPAFQHVGIGIPDQRVVVGAAPQVLDADEYVTRRVVIVRGLLRPGLRQIDRHPSLRMCIGRGVAPAPTVQRIRPGPAFQHVDVRIPGQMIRMAAPP